MLPVFRLLRYAERLAGLPVGVPCPCRKEGVTIAIFTPPGKARSGPRQLHQPQTVILNHLTNVVSGGTLMIGKRTPGETERDQTATGVDHATPWSID
ncbi:Uncharacterised protein [Shigella sonnei]|nr:Uncharacterised protein [Shigella sonnei]CSW70432.1 Uncharacterised protein [Shigella sonnei]